MSEEPQRSLEGRPIAVRVAILAVAAAFGLYLVGDALVSSLPTNVVREEANRGSLLFQLAPQGWSFFTRDAREADLVLYGVRPDGTLVNRTTGPSTDFGRRFGFDRSVRAQQAEIAPVLARLPKTAFSQCVVEVASCARGLTVQATLDNEYPVPTVCGDVVIAFREPVPWAWAHDGVDQPMPARLAKVTLRC